MNFGFSTICADEDAMQQLGFTLSQQLLPGTLVFLNGELGAGKSFLARAIIHAAGYVGRVKSPTYTLIESYDIESPATAIARIAHLDLYRLSDPDELYHLGFDDVLGQHDLVMIEWPEKAIEYLPSATVNIVIDYLPADARNVTVKSTTDVRAK